MHFCPPPVLVQPQWSQGLVSRLLSALVLSKLWGPCASGPGLTQMHLRPFPTSLFPTQIIDDPSNNSHSAPPLPHINLSGHPLKWMEGKEKRCPISLLSYQRTWEVLTQCPYTMYRLCSTICSFCFYLVLFWFLTYFIRTDCAFVYSSVIIVLIFCFQLVKKYILKKGKIQSKELKLKQKRKNFKWLILSWL